MGLYLWAIVAIALSVLMAGAWHRDEVESILRPVYGSNTNLWMRRWRWFLLATAGLFGLADGSEWGVSHYRMKAGSS
jgi:cyclopropane-fatty-acyl-phospholipid synthase